MTLGRLRLSVADARGLAQELADLRIEKAGGLVIKGPEGAPKIIVRVAGAS